MGEWMDRSPCPLPDAGRGYCFADSAGPLSQPLPPEERRLASGEVGGRGEDAGDTQRAQSRRRYGVGASGSRTMNALPWPGVLSTVTVPP
jgi:hypothetical protein